MSSLQSKFLVSAAALILGFSAMVHAQTSDAIPVGTATDETEVLKPLTINDIRVMFDSGISKLRTTITKSQNLTFEERVSMSRNIEKEAEGLREQLDEIWMEATEMGERSYPIGIVISYFGEVNFPAVKLPAAKYGPGAELGFALFLKKNAQLSEAIRAADVAIFTAGVNLERDAKPIASRQISKGLKLKILWVRDNKERPALTLKDFTGFYTGIGAKLNMFGGKDLGEVYTKPETCDFLNPLACSIYVYSFRGLRTTEMGAELKEMYIHFPDSNDKRGFSF